MKELNCLILLSCVSVLSVTAESELICSQRPIKVLAGYDVILPCHLEPPISVTDEMVLWSRSDLKPKYVHYHQEGRLMIDRQNPSCRHRTRLFMDELMNGNVSMKIFKVKMSDAGTFVCSLPSMKKEASVQLIVGQSDVTGSHEPVNATVGYDVILPCHLEPPYDVTSLTVEWRRNKDIVHVYRNRKDDPGLQDENFRRRTSLFFDELIRGNISLKLTNVTEQDEGNYTCFVPKLDSQVRRGFIKLIVDPEENRIKGNQTDSGYHGFIVLIIPIIAIVATVVIVMWRRRVNHNAGEDGRGQHEEVETDDIGDEGQVKEKTGEDNTNISLTQPKSTLRDSNSSSPHT